MARQKNISVTEDVYERLEAWKTEQQSFGDAITKLLESVDSKQVQFGATSVERLKDVTDSFEADEDGTLTIDIMNEEGEPIGIVELSELETNQTVYANITSGERS